MNRACENYCSLIEDLVAGDELDEQIAARIESHVLGCARCRNEYELLLREKEALAHYLFEFEPPAQSLANFQARLIEQDELPASDAMVSPANLLRRPRRKHLFAVGFSPAGAAAFAGLLLFFGIGFVLLSNAVFEKNAERYVAETKSKVLPPVQSSETAQKLAPDWQADKGGAKNNAPRSGVQSLKERSSSLFGKTAPAAADTVKIKEKVVSSGERKKPVTEAAASDERQAETLRKQNLETEITGQIERIELLLRSFRNAPANEAAEGFDVEYEKQQARKLLAQNARLKRESEDYGIAAAEELLSRVEPYLLDIAHLETNSAPDRVLDIKARVGSQNIIASLQMFNPVAAR